MSTPEPVDPPQRRSFARLVVEDFRSVRRWLILLGALAVIATAVAVYALLQGGDSADQQRVEQLERRVSEAQRRLRGTGEESDVNQLERSERGRQAEIRALRAQMSRIERRLRNLERDVSAATDAAADTGSGLSRLNDRVGGLSTRIGDVEDRQPGGR